MIWHPCLFPTPWQAQFIYLIKHHKITNRIKEVKSDFHHSVLLAYSQCCIFRNQCEYVVVVFMCVCDCWINRYHRFLLVCIDLSHMQLPLHRLSSVFPFHPACPCSLSAVCRSWKKSRSTKSKSTSSQRQMMRRRWRWSGKSRSVLLKKPSI